MQTASFPLWWHLVDVPIVISGLSLIYMDKSSGIRIWGDKNTITTSNVDVSVFTWKPFVLWDGDVSWMKLPSVASYGIQAGSFDTEVYSGSREWSKDRGGKEEKISCYVTFGKPYLQPPKVISWLEGIDINESTPRANRRLKTDVENITQNGFLISITTWADTYVPHAKAGWLAYDSSANGISSGVVFPLNDNGTAMNPAEDVTFPAGTFTKTPEVFVALRYIDVEHRENFHGQVKG